MYNRYIPQPDGSYRRSRIPDQESRRTPAPTKPEKPCEEPAADIPCHPEPEICRDPKPKRPPKYSRSNSCRVKKPQPLPPPERCHGNVQKKEPHCEEKGSSVSNFFRQLLPKDFDTGDLLVILLLLLMSGDCTEDQNSALLTLVLYLFM